MPCCAVHERYMTKDAAPAADTHATIQQWIASLPDALKRAIERHMTKDAAPAADTHATIQEITSRLSILEQAVRTLANEPGAGKKRRPGPSTNTAPDRNEIRSEDSGGLRAVPRMSDIAGRTTANGLSGLTSDSSWQPHAAARPRIDSRPWTERDATMNALSAINAGNRAAPCNNQWAAKPRVRVQAGGAPVSTQDYQGTSLSPTSPAELDGLGAALAVRRARQQPHHPVSVQAKQDAFWAARRAV